MAATLTIDGREVTQEEFQAAGMIREVKTIPEQIENARVKTPEETELEALVASLKLTRDARAGDEGTLAAKKLLYETENSKLIGSIKLSKEAEITLTNKIRFLALKVHALNGRKKLANDKVTIKMFTQKELIYKEDQVMKWARKQAPALILEVLDKASFEAMLTAKGMIQDPESKEFIAQVDIKTEPRAQISTIL